MIAHDLNPAARRIVTLCDAVAKVAGPDAAPALDAVRATLGPPRIAVVGRVKAGKSTIVNALIGTRVAPTNEAECTRVVTWYRFGAPDSAELVLTDGTVRPISFAGSLPDDLGVPAEEISHAVVYLQQKSLQDYILIDTPGLATTTTENEEATRRAILGEDAARQADGLIYVFKGTEKADDIEFIGEFTRASGEDARAVRTLGVLSNADRYGTGAWGAKDPIDVAAEFAGRIAAEQAKYLSTVIPIAARMGEAARTGEVRESDALTLSALADLDDDEMQDLEDRPAAIAGADERAVARAVTLFRGYALRHGRAVARRGASALTRWLLDRSHTAELDRAIRERFLGMHPQRSIADALSKLDEVARSSAKRRELEELINSARLEPDLHVVRELAARDRIAHRNPDDALVAELDRMMVERDDRARLGLPADADLLATARTRSNEHRAGAALASRPEEVDAHRVLARSYLLVAQRAETR